MFRNQLEFLCAVALLLPRPDAQTDATRRQRHPKLAADDMVKASPVKVPERGHVARCLGRSEQCRQGARAEYVGRRPA